MVMSLMLLWYNKIGLKETSVIHQALKKHQSFTPMKEYCKGHEHVAQQKQWILCPFIFCPVLFRFI